HLATHQIRKRGCCAPVRYVDQVDIGHHLEQFAGHMVRGSDTGRGEIDLAGISLGIGDELANRFDRKRWIYHQDIGYAKDTRDRRNIVHEIEIEIVVQRRTNQIACGDQKERIAVGGSTYDRLCTDVGACSRPVLDDKWLAESLRQPLSDQAREDVGRIASGTRYNNAHSSGGIRLRPSNMRDPGSTAAPAARCSKFRRGSFMSVPL